MGASGRIADQPQTVRAGDRLVCADGQEVVVVGDALPPTWAELAALALPGALDDVE